MFSLSGNTESQDIQITFSHEVALVKNIQESLTADFLSEVFSHLNAKTLGLSGQVSKEWKKLALKFIDEKKVRLYRDVVFSPIDWNIHFGNNFINHDEQAKAFQSLIPNIDEIVCPLDQTKSLAETHVIVWLPTGLTINKFGELLKIKFPNNQNGYFEILPEIQDQYGDLPVEESGWIAMTKTVIQGSLSHDYNFQEKLDLDIPCKNKQGYDVPHLLKAIVAVAVPFFKWNLRIYENYYTICQEDINGSLLRVRFDKRGLDVYNGYFDTHQSGVAAIRSF